MPFNRPGTIKAIHAMGRNHGYDHDDLRALAVSLFQIPADKVSISKLTDSQLIAMADSLRGQSSGKGPAPVYNKATKRQLWKIDQLATLLGMSGNPARLEGFLQRQAKKTRLTDLTKQDAIKVIDGLKTMYERGVSPE